jgi:hypothetical protein
MGVPVPPSIFCAMRQSVATLTDARETLLLGFPDSEKAP